MKITISYENKIEYLDAIKALNTKFRVLKTSKPYQISKDSPYRRIYAILDSRKNISIKTLNL